MLISQFTIAAGIIDTHLLSMMPAGFPQMSVPVDGGALRRNQERWVAEHGGPPPGGRTLVYCESGNERSAAVAAAYIMQHLGGSTVQAIQMVQGKRFCVCFDDSMKWMLKSYEPIWRARMQVGGGGGRGKRRMEEEDDDEVGAMGMGRAPFVDEDMGDDMMA
jgi:hypothetical protein